MNGNTHFFDQEMIGTQLKMDTADKEKMFNLIFEDVAKSDVSTLIWKNSEHDTLDRNAPVLRADDELVGVCLAKISDHDQEIGKAEDVPKRNHAAEMQYGKYLDLLRILELSHGDIDLHKLFGQRKIMHIFILSVSQTHQRRGLGLRAMIESIIAAKDKQQVDVAFCETTSPLSSNMVEKMGFVKLNEFPYRQFRSISAGEAIFANLPGSVQLWARNIESQLHDDPLKREIISRKL